MATGIGTRRIKDLAVTNAKLAGSIATAKLADASSFVMTTGANAFGADQSMGGNRLTNLSAGTSGTDAVNKNQLDQAINDNVLWKFARVAATGNVNLSSGLQVGSGATIDGVTLEVGDVVFLPAQTNPAENGLYSAPASGTASRIASFDEASEIRARVNVLVSEGTTNANSNWTLTTNGTIVVGMTNLTFTQTQGTYTAGTGISITGSEIALDITAGDGISVSGDTISVSFGTTGTTACVGNDSRLSDARTPVGTALTSARIWVGNGSDVAAAVAVSGDVALANNGAMTVSSSTVAKFSQWEPQEVPTGTIDGTNTTFTLAATPVDGTEEVYVDGVQMLRGTDYTITGGAIEFVSGSTPGTGEALWVNYWSQA